MSNKKFPAPQQLYLGVDTPSAPGEGERVEIEETFTPGEWCVKVWFFGLPYRFEGFSAKEDAELDAQKIRALLPGGKGRGDRCP